MQRRLNSDNLSLKTRLSYFYSVTLSVEDFSTQPTQMGFCREILLETWSVIHCAACTQHVLSFHPCKLSFTLVQKESRAFSHQAPCCGSSSRSRYGRLASSRRLDLKPSALRELTVGNSVGTVTVLVRLINI